MKYIKTYEIKISKYGYNPKDIDLSDIYVYDYYISPKRRLAEIGKIKYSEEFSSYFIFGFYIKPIENENKTSISVLNTENFSNVRKATPDEIDLYNLLKNVDKYNL